MMICLEQTLTSRPHLWAAMFSLLCACQGTEPETAVSPAPDGSPLAEPTTPPETHGTPALLPSATPGSDRTPPPPGTPLPPATPVPAPDDWDPGEVPADPSSVAPPLEPGVAIVLYDATTFLWTGPNAIQRGVEPGAFDPERIAVIRGEVWNTWGEPLPGVDVFVRDRLEYGTTRTREDGRFDLVLNGGQSVLLRLEAGGLLPVQRRVRPGWQRETTIEPVVLLEPESIAARVRLDGQAQVVRGPISEDEDGLRQPTLLIPEGLEAWMDLPSGRQEPLIELSLRLTEYTLGELGPRSMPGELPDASAYTYAFELTADELLETGATRLSFNTPIPLYNENFLVFPAGTNVPVGYYDPPSGRWLPSENGVVLDVVGVEDGLAELDVAGTGRPSDRALLGTLGISDEERRQLAEIYETGASLWRVALPHFSSWDSNWGWGPPADAVAASGGPKPKDEECDPCAKPGSILDVHNRVLGEVVEVPGTGFRLHYRSDRVPGRVVAYTLEIPVTGPEVPESLKRVEVELDVAGQRHAWMFGPESDQVWPFVWDGLDGYGRVVQGTQVVSGQTGYVYDGVYEETETFGYDGNGTEITGDPTREEVTLWTRWEATVGTWDARAQGLGGWTLNEHHAYDPNARALYYGDGRQQGAWSAVEAIETFVGGGDNPYDGAPASERSLGYPYGVVTDGAGSVFISDVLSWTVEQVRPDETVYTYAGTPGSHGFWGDGGPATEAGLWNPLGLALDGDGSLYIADSRNNRIRRVDPEGIIGTVAGNGEWEGIGDGGPATEGQLSWPSDVTVDTDGNLYIADTYHHRVRHVGPDNRIHTLAGTGAPGFRGDGGQATRAQLNMPYAVSVGPEGSIYIADGENYRVRRVSRDGMIDTVAGRGLPTRTGDGGPATEATIGVPTDLAFDKEGALYIADSRNGVVRRVSSEGIIETVAGVGDNAEGGDGGAATSAGLDEPGGVWVDERGELLIADTNNWRVRRVGRNLPPYTGESVQLVSKDGQEGYRFDEAGRHLETVDALTGWVKFRFHYDDESGLLSAVEDGDGNVTTIERDDGGEAMALVSPWGVRAELEMDGNGYLSSLTDPTGATWKMSYSPGGLLEAFAEPSGGETGLEGLESEGGYRKR